MRVFLKGHCAPVSTQSPGCGNLSRFILSRFCTFDVVLQRGMDFVPLLFYTFCLDCKLCRTRMYSYLCL